MIDALKCHWPEYLIEGTCLALFMVSAFTFGTILEHPASLVHQAIPSPVLRRLLMGLAMGGTAVAIIYSPWGKQSGAHINPSTTITFFRLGKIKVCDAAFYLAFQFAGGLLGALAAATMLSTWAHGYAGAIAADRENHFIGTLRVRSAAILSERWRLNRILPNWSGSLNA
jgi:aquaporin Z